MVDAEQEQPPYASVDDEGESRILKIRIESMHRKLKEPPRLLSSAAGKPTCSIFRVPQSMIDNNGRCYEPRVVSVGPYHRGQPHLNMIEEHKWHYLKVLLTRTHQTKKLTLEDYMKSVKNVEDKARECYSESIIMESEDFNEMMVLDGCFLLELFRKVSELISFELDDPLVNMAWVLPFFYRDFLRLENQIPFFVLEILFDLTRGDNEIETKASLPSLAFEFFNNVMHRPATDLPRFEEISCRAKHLLDLVRLSFIPKYEKHVPSIKKSGKKETPNHIIHSISKLRQAGIKLRELKDAESFLVVKFKHGVMPKITVDDYMGSFLQNCVAYEQCHVACSKHFTTYTTLLDCLMNINRDVEYLCEQNIIENYFGTEGEVAGLANSLGKDVAFDPEQSYLNELFGEVNEYYNSGWHKEWASFQYTYFRSPWSFVSALAALILLILSIIQTIYTVVQAYQT